MIQLFLICLYAAIGIQPSAGKMPGAPGTINPVIGYAGYIHRFGCLPDASADGSLLIRTHLEFVEALLRIRPVAHLTPELRERRAAMLDDLHVYRTAGRFPRNYDHPGRRMPCFIDRDGAICAVGYLIEQSAGRAVAESINARHRYDAVMDMHDADINRWIAASGLTKEECAMIQPNYGYYPPANDPGLRGEHAISTALLSGANLAFNAIGIAGMARNKSGTAVPMIGLLTGAGQFILGASMISRGEYPGGAEGTAAMINMGLGTATLITSVWSLASGRPSGEKKTTLSVAPFPAGGTAGVALGLRHRF